VGAEGTGVGATADTSSAGCAATAFFAAVFFAGFAAAGATAGMASRTRRSTGGVTVEDALLTYSPNSWSLASSVFESTPKSLASS